MSLWVQGSRSDMRGGRAWATLRRSSSIPVCCGRGQTYHEYTVGVGGVPLGWRTTLTDGLYSESETSGASVLVINAVPPLVSARRAIACRVKVETPSRLAGCSGGRSPSISASRFLPHRAILHRRQSHEYVVYPWGWWRYSPTHFVFLGCVRLHWLPEPYFFLQSVF